MTNSYIGFVHISEDPSAPHNRPAHCAMTTCSLEHVCAHCGTSLKYKDVFGTWYQEGDKHERLFCSPCAAGIDLMMQNLRQEAQSIFNS